MDALREGHPHLLVLPWAEALGAKKDCTGAVVPASQQAATGAKRGVGKTYAAQAVAWAVITSGSWLRFEVERPTEVLYIDGVTSLLSGI